jgi:hypothetical protein
MRVRVRIMVRVRWYRRTGRCANSQTTKVARESLCLVAVLTRLLAVGIDIAHWAGWVAGEGDKGGAEGAGDVFERHLHWGDVGAVAFCGPGEDMAADAAGWTVEDPCAGVAGGC